jgi:integrase
MQTNYAMVLLLARLGIRPQEVIAIQIGDIDWRSGEIMVRGQGARHDRLPPTDTRLNPGSHRTSTLQAVHSHEPLGFWGLSASRLLIPP